MACNIIFCFLLVFLFAFLSRVPSEKKKKKQNQNSLNFIVLSSVRISNSIPPYAKVLAVSVHEKGQDVDVWKGLPEEPGGCGLWLGLSGRNVTFSKAHGQDGITGPNPGEDCPRAASFSERWQSLLKSGSALSFCTQLNHFDGGSVSNWTFWCRQAEHSCSPSTISPRKTPPTPTQIKKSKIQLPLPFDIDILISCRLISSDVLSPKKLIFI